MKRLFISLIFVTIYIVYILFSLSPGGGHHATEIYDIILGHLTDHVISPVSIKQDENVVVLTAKKINNFIAEDLNNKIFKEKQFELLGINFDMRITRWVLMLWITAFLCILIFIPLAMKMKKNKMVPESRWVNFWEAAVSHVHDDIVEPNFHHEYVNKAMPYFCTVFFFIILCNFIGLFPGSSTPTGNLAVTGGLALFTLFSMIAVGVVRQGPLWFITGIVPHGIPILIFPILWVIELVGLLIKPFALTVRLFANMTAGHVVIIIFLYLIMMFQSFLVGIASVVMSLVIFALELLVAYIQALIFTTLSAMFIGSSMQAH